MRWSSPSTIATALPLHGLSPPKLSLHKKFSTEIQGSQDKGKETINGVECDRVTLTERLQTPIPGLRFLYYLPRKFVATFKDREGSPQMTVDFSEDWNLAAALEESVFAFDSTEGRGEDIMVTVDDANATTRRAERNDCDIQSASRLVLLVMLGVASHATVVRAQRTVYGCARPHHGGRRPTARGRGRAGAAGGGRRPGPCGGAIAGGGHRGQTGPDTGLSRWVALATTTSVAFTIGRRSIRAAPATSACTCDSMAPAPRSGVA